MQNTFMQLLLSGFIMADPTLYSHVVNGLRSSLSFSEEFRKIYKTATKRTYSYLKN